MPTAQPERENPFMRRYSRKTGLSGKQLAKRCGVSHSRIYVARTGSVGAKNAEKISRGMARMFGLPEMDRLELKAGILSRPGDRVRACFGPHRGVMETLGVSEPTALELINEEKSIAHAGGGRALARLREMGRRISSRNPWKGASGRPRRRRPPSPTTSVIPRWPSSRRG